MNELRYKKLQNQLKASIQQGVYVVGDLLPSENELCTKYKITRTTVRKALDELQKEGFVERHHGKGSIVRERRQSLGLLNVKGFSEAVGENVKTIMLQKPNYRQWSSEIVFPVADKERNSNCIHFERLRCVGNEPVMLENNWFADCGLEGFLELDFIEGSFFKTLSQKYLIEITGSSQELRAEFADNKIAPLLKVRVGNPVLHISLIFNTSKPGLNIYAELYCNTNKFPIGNNYHL